MTIVLNGEKKSFPAPLALGDLLSELKLTPGRLACEVNGEVVRRADYAKTSLKDGDTVEIVQMIGGG